jgi:hypothetical protein
VHRFAAVVPALIVACALFTPAEPAIETDNPTSVMVVAAHDYHNVESHPEEAHDYH